MNPLRLLFSITGLGGIIVVWELVALAFFPNHIHSALFARRSPGAIPIAVLAVWLPLHLLRYKHGAPKHRGR